MGKLSKKSLSESFTFEAKTRIKFDEVMKKKLKSQVLIFFYNSFNQCFITFQLHFLLRKAGFCKINKRIKKYNPALKLTCFCKLA